MCNSFFHLLPTVFCSAVVLGAFLCTAAATSSGGTSGLRTVRPPCKLKWVCDHILSKDKPRRKDKLKTFWQTLTFQLDLTLIPYKEDKIVQFCGVREQHQWLTYQGGCLFLKFLIKLSLFFKVNFIESFWKVLFGPEELILLYSMGFPFVCAFYLFGTELLTCWIFFPSLTLISRNMCAREEGKPQIPGPSLAITAIQMLRLPTITSKWNIQKLRQQSLFSLLSPSNEIPLPAVPTESEKNQAQRLHIKNMHKPPY